MQIALTKKLADATGESTKALPPEDNPLFSWTANWAKAWDNRRTEDMIVLVNHATRFTVAIYQVKRKDLKNMAEMMKQAIGDTLLSLNFNPAIVEEYLRLAGEVEFIRNRDRKAAAWVSKAGMECAFHVGREFNGIDKIFCNTAGAKANERTVSASGSSVQEEIVPLREMIRSLSDLTGLPVYRYRAFELLVTLDLDVYQAVRRIIVPAGLELRRFHKVLQSVFGWRDYHLHDFTIFGKDQEKPLLRLVPDEEDLFYDDRAVLIRDQKLQDIFPEHKEMTYTYDFGDDWEHRIQLIRVIEDHDQPSPYLLEASGQAPPEDVGGVWGFVAFREIILDPTHPQYPEMKEWAGYWEPELPAWKQRPGAIWY